MCSPSTRCSPQKSWTKATQAGIETSRFLKAGTRCRHRSPTGMQDSAYRIAYTICSAENVDRLMGPLLSQRTAEAAIVL